MLTRMFALITLASYLLVGSIAFRIFSPDSYQFSFDTNYFRPLADVEIYTSEVVITAPEMKFAEVKIPVEHATKKKKIQSVEVVVAAPVVSEEERTVVEGGLPFEEPVKLEPVVLKEELQTDLVASYRDFAFEEKTDTAVADNVKVEDAVSTVAASTEVAEPEFFEYEQEAKQETTQVVAVPASKQSEKPAPEEVDVNDLVSFDYSAPKPQTPEAVTGHAAVAAAPVEPEKQFSFDYSRASKSAPRVTSHKPTTNSSALAAAVGPKGIVEDSKSTHKSAKARRYPMALTIQAIGTDITRTENLNSFEVRFKDDEGASQTDFGTGEVRLLDTLAQSKMTRAISLLKRGYIPTSTDVILEEGERNVTIPLFDESKFNQLQQEFEGKTPVGALLLELDDDTELAQIDVPFGKVLTLNGDLEEMESSDYRYQLFLGVRAGNALVTYKQRSGETVKKIVHVLEGELTFDANYYETLVNEKIKLLEEDLLSHEASPLIVSEDAVKIFASDKHSSKNDSNTYKLDFGPVHLAGRRYIELLHSEEPIFVGVRDNNLVKVPSENFIRHTLSRFEDAKLGSRCLVQVNLREEAVAVDVGSESVASTLSTYTQMLDNDGKFYDSLSSKTKKLIIVGESSAPENVSADARINVRIENADGSVQYLNSYCSPNTYLVEQL